MSTGVFPNVQYPGNQVTWSNVHRPWDVPREKFLPLNNPTPMGDQFLFNLSRKFSRPFPTLRV